MLIKTGILLRPIEIIFGVSFNLTFINIQNSLFYNSKQYFKFCKSSNFCFPNFYVMNICQNLYSNHYCQIFQELRSPEALQLNDSLVLLPEIQRTIFKSLFRTLPCFKVNLGNQRLLYVLVGIDLLFF